MLHSQFPDISPPLSAYRIRLQGEARGPGLQNPCHLGVRTLPIISLLCLADPSNPIYRRVTRPHGSSGVVKSKFRSNLPPHAFGASVRVVRYLCCCISRCRLLKSLCFYNRCSTPPTFKSLTIRMRMTFTSFHTICANMICMHEPIFSNAPTHGTMYDCTICAPMR
jgi:hypothetical protein